MNLLPPAPTSLISTSGQPLNGLWAGGMPADPRAGGARRGRRRSWSYSALADGNGVAFGAAIVNLGIASTAFAWLLLDGEVHTWDTKGAPLQASIGRTPTTKARYVGRGLHVRIHGDGCLDLDVPLGKHRFRVTTVRESMDQDVPATLLTDTVDGGWNGTQKVAGERFTYLGSLDGRTLQGAGMGWRDWTVGAQDRRTRWRWAAAVGRSQAGHRVGLNLSTGMNDHGPGENVVWWDGEPHHLDLEVLGPMTARDDGPWRVSGPDWALDFEPVGHRSARENLLIVRSAYTQPIGSFSGTLPSPAGVQNVDLFGVTEDHQAVW